MIKIGKLNDRAGHALSTFVIICICITVGLLYILEKSERTASNIYSVTYYDNKI